MADTTCCIAASIDAKRYGVRTGTPVWQARKLCKDMVFVQARLKSEVRVKPGLTRFLPALLGGEYERAEVEAVKWQGSGDMAANAGANCYLVTPPESEIMKAGDMVSVLLI